MHKNSFWFQGKSKVDKGENVSEVQTSRFLPRPARAALPGLGQERDVPHRLPSSPVCIPHRLPEVGPVPAAGMKEGGTPRATPSGSATCSQGLNLTVPHSLTPLSHRRCSGTRSLEGKGPHRFIAVNLIEDRHFLTFHSEMPGPALRSSSASRPQHPYQAAAQKCPLLGSLPFHRITPGLCGVWRPFPRGPSLHRGTRGVVGSTGWASGRVRLHRRSGCPPTGGSSSVHPTVPSLPPAIILSASWMQQALPDDGAFHMPDTLQSRRGPPQKVSRGWGRRQAVAETGKRRGRHWASGVVIPLAATGTQPNAGWQDPRSRAHTGEPGTQTVARVLLSLSPPWSVWGPPQVARAERACRGERCSPL